MKIFFSVLAAIAVAVYIFLPDLLPAGIGSRDLDLEFHIETSVAANLGLSSERTVAMTNKTPRTLCNLNLYVCSPDNKKSVHFVYEKVAPGEVVRFNVMDTYLGKGSRIGCQAAGYDGKNYYQ